MLGGVAAVRSTVERPALNQTIKELSAVVRET